MESKSPRFLSFVMTEVSRMRQKGAEIRQIADFSRLGRVRPKPSREAESVKFKQRQTRVHFIWSGFLTLTVTFWMFGMIVGWDSTPKTGLSSFGIYGNPHSQEYSRLNN